MFVGRSVRRKPCILDCCVIFAFVTYSTAMRTFVVKATTMRLLCDEILVDQVFRVFVCVATQ